MNSNQTSDQIVNSIRNDFTDIQERAKILKTPEAAILDDLRKLCQKANEYIFLLPDELKLELQQAFILVRTKDVEQFVIDI